MHCGGEQQLGMQGNARARFRAELEQLKWSYGLLPEGQGLNLALTVLYEPCSTDDEDGADAEAAEQRPSIVYAGTKRCVFEKSDVLELPECVYFEMLDGRKTVLCIFVG